MTGIIGCIIVPRGDYDLESDRSFRDRILAASISPHRRLLAQHATGDELDTIGWKCGLIRFGLEAQPQKGKSNV